MEAEYTKGDWTVLPDDSTVQQCCLAYGGNSFPGPMSNALMCHLSLLRKEHPEWEAAPELLKACKELADIFPEFSMSEMDASDFKDRANRIWAASQSAKNIIAKCEKG